MFKTSNTNLITRDLFLKKAVVGAAGFYVATKSKAAMGTMPFGFWKKKPIVNYSYSFPNTANTGADYAGYDANSNLSLGTSDLTIESYVYLNTSTADDWAYMGTGDPSSGNVYSTWHCFILSDYTVKVDIYGGSAVRSATKVSPNVWNYLAWVRSSGTWSIYINGLKDAYTYSDSTSLVGPGLVLGTAYYPTHSGEDFQGYLNNVRVSTAALYSSNFTPPTTNLTALGSTVALTAQNNTFVDNSGTGQTITAYGSAATSTFVPF